MYTHLFISIAHKTLSSAVLRESLNYEYYYYQFVFLYAHPNPAEVWAKCKTGDIHGNVIYIYRHIFRSTIDSALSCNIVPCVDPANSQQRGKWVFLLYGMYLVYIYIVRHCYIVCRLAGAPLQDLSAGSRHCSALGEVFELLFRELLCICISHGFMCNTGKI